MNTHVIERDNGCAICQMWLDSNENWNPETKKEPKKELEYHTVRVASVPADSSIPEVYAANIMTSQIEAILPKDKHDPDDINTERKHFLEFLKEKWNAGWRWENQLIAWNDYKNTTDGDDFTEEEADVNWQQEIEDIIDGAFRARNYSEYGGQQ
jgi:hypothetical protein